LCHCSLSGEGFVATLVEHSTDWCIAGVTVVPGSVDITAEDTQPLVMQLLLLQPCCPENEADYQLLQASQMAAAAVAAAAAAAEVPAPHNIAADATVQLQQQLGLYEAECAALLPLKSFDTRSQQQWQQQGSNCHATAVKEQQQQQQQQLQAEQRPVAEVAMQQVEQCTAAHRPQGTLGAQEQQQVQDALKLPSADARKAADKKASQQ
jgi:hypothetical protein